MLKTSDIIGYKIICSDNKKFGGEVKDVILDLNECKLSGLVIDYGSVIHHSRVLDFKDIYEIVRNKVIVKYKKNIQQIQKNNFNERHIRKNQIILGIEVLGEEGNLLGFIHDVLFEEKSGNILGFILTNGIVDDIFNGVEILPIDGPVNFNNKRLVISQNSRKNILRNIGGLKKLLELEH